MASLTIGGQVRELHLSATDIIEAEVQIIKRGGRVILAVLASQDQPRERALFSMLELQWLCWGAWRHRMSDARVPILLAQFYAEGGTIFDLHSAVVEALIDSGVYGKRQASTSTIPEETDATDPPTAAGGMSG